MTYTLHLGDCLEIMPTLQAGSIDAIITDPPYGIDYQSARRTDKTQWKPKINNDKEPFLAWLPEAYRVTKDGGALICFCRWDVEGEFKKEIEKAGFEVKSQIIWDKVIHGMGDLESSFAPQHENIWFATKGKFKFHNYRPKSVIRCSRVPAEDMIHPNEKPVSLFSSLIEPLVTTKGIVLDCFMGSGNSGVASRRLDRNYIGIDNDPKHFGNAEKRIKQATLQPSLFAPTQPKAEQSGMF